MKRSFDSVSPLGRWKGRSVPSAAHLRLGAFTRGWITCWSHWLENDSPRLSNSFTFNPVRRCSSAGRLTTSLYLRFIGLFPSLSCSFVHPPILPHPSTIGEEVICYYHGFWVSRSGIKFCSLSLYGKPLPRCRLYSVVVSWDQILNHPSDSLGTGLKV